MSAATEPNVLMVVDEAAWKAWDASGAAEYKSPMMEADGFIHMSTVAQVATVGNRFFAAATAPLLLVIIDSAALGEALVFEPGVPPAGAARTEEDDKNLFPHLYAPLPRTAVLRTQPFEKGSDGLYPTPSL